MTSLLDWTPERQILPRPKITSVRQVKTEMRERCLTIELDLGHTSYLVRATAASIFLDVYRAGLRFGILKAHEEVETTILRITHNLGFVKLLNMPPERAARRIWKDIIDALEFPVHVGRGTLNEAIRTLRATLILLHPDLSQISGSLRCGPSLRRSLRSCFTSVACHESEATKNSVDESRMADAVIGYFCVRPREINIYRDAQHDDISPATAIDVGLDLTPLSAHERLALTAKAREIVQDLVNKTARDRHKEYRQRLVDALSPRRSRFASRNISIEASS